MKKIIFCLTSFMVAIGSALVLIVGHASAATFTWDGGGSDNNMSTAANWVGDSAPEEGDNLVFPAGVSKKTVVNDYDAGTSFSSITFSGSTSSGETNYIISGSSIQLTDGVTTDFDGNGGAPVLSLNVTLGSQALVTSEDNLLTLAGSVGIGANTIVFDGAGDATVAGAITGSGTIIKDGIGTLALSGANTGFSGAITDGMGIVVAADRQALGTNAAGTTVNNGAKLLISLPEDQKTATITEPITLKAENYDPDGGDLVGILQVEAECGLSYCENSNITLSGTLTLTSNVRLDMTGTTRFTGTVNGAYTIKISDGQYGALVIDSDNNNSLTANGTYVAAIITKTYADNLPSQSITVNKNITAVVTGTYGTVYVNKYGTLKGTGTVGTVYLAEGGIIAPGMSPGILNTGNLVYSGGSQQFELGGTANGQFDQLNVTGTVNLGSGTTLDASLYDGFKPAVGDSFMIIRNNGSDAISGRFKDLPNGSTFKVSGYTFKISYNGGTGNDVVITVTALPPQAPNTGIAFVTRNPLISLVLLTIVTPVFALAARRSYIAGKL